MVRSEEFSSRDANSEDLHRTSKWRCGGGSKVYGAEGEMKYSGIWIPQSSLG